QLTNGFVSVRYGVEACDPSSRCGHLEHVVAPRGFVEIEAAREQIAAIPVIGGRSHQILQAHWAPAEIGERQPDVALTLVPGVVHGDQSPLTVRRFPRPRNETIPGPVPVPGRYAREKTPLSIAKDRLSQYRQKALVEPFQRLVDGFRWRAHEV